MVPMTTTRLTDPDQLKAMGKLLDSLETTTMSRTSGTASRTKRTCRNKVYLRLLTL